MNMSKHILSSHSLLLSDIFLPPIFQSILRCTFIFFYCITFYTYILRIHFTRTFICILFFQFSFTTLCRGLFQQSSFKASFSAITPPPLRESPRLLALTTNGLNLANGALMDKQPAQDSGPTLQQSWARSEPNMPPHPAPLSGLKKRLGNRPLCSAQSWPTHTHTHTTEVDQISQTKPPVCVVDPPLLWGRMPSPVVRFTCKRGH